jgi:hypothetical protein
MQIPKIIDAKIKLFESNWFKEILSADHSRTPHPFIEKGTIPIKFKNTEIKKLYSKTELIFTFINNTNKDREKNN